MPKEIDLIGERFGRLTVVYRDYGKQQKKTYYYCVCDCGNEKSIRADALRSGRTQSCGCYHGDTGSKKSTNKKYNKYSMKHDCVEIYTNKNETILVDIEDFEYVRNLCWSINSVGYCQARLRDKVVVLIHREIMKNYTDIDDLVIDHKNHNKLDNRKMNLRVCRQQKNTFNTGIRSNNTSGVTGVSWDKEKHRLGITERLSLLADTMI